MFDKFQWFTLLIFLLPFSAFSQIDKSNYALFWEISGGDLPQSSYLFGTMHVQDERAFEFPDSVVWAWQTCDAYAMEVHPEMMSDFFLDLYTNPDTTNILRTMLSPAAYERIDQLVIKKEGKPLDSLNFKDPFLVELMLQDFDEPQDTKKKAQPVDFYLFKQFSLQKKSLFGLEKMSDYQNLTQSFFNIFEKDNQETLEPEATEAEKKVAFENMLDIYRRGDLAEMQQLIEQYEVDEDYDYQMLGQRNINMVDAFLKIAKKQSLFGAVGTAHLPGKVGMLELFRKKGYQVRRVIPTFTGAQETYIMPESSKSWALHQNSTFGYQLKTPTKLVSFKLAEMPDSSVMEMKVGMDLLEMNFYLLTNLKYSQPVDQDDLKDFYQGIVNDWSGDEEAKILNYEKITKNEIEGARFKTKIGAEYWQWWEIYFRAGHLHLYSVLRQFDDGNMDDINQFFASIELTALPEVTSSRFYAKQGGYSIELPENRSFFRKNIVKEAEGKTVKTVLYGLEAKDLKKDVAYLIQHFDVGVRNTIVDVEAAFQLQMSSFAKAFGEPTQLIIKSDFMGCPARETVYSFSGAKIFAKFIIRGKRVYILMKEVGANAEKSNPSGAFESFKFEPLVSSPWTESSLLNGTRSLSLPNEYLVDTLQEIAYPIVSNIEIISMDTLNSATFKANFIEYSAYYQGEYGPDYFSTYLNETCNSDKFITCQDTIFQGKKAVYLEFDLQNIGIQSHNLLFYEGNFLNELTLQMPLEINSQLAWKYFNSYSNKLDFSEDFFKINKTEKLLTDLQSTDYATQRRAKVEMLEHEFVEADLPQIYAALEKEYPADTMTSPLAYQQLLDELAFYTNDGSTIPFLKQLFPKKGGDEAQQIAILEALTITKSATSFTAFFELLKSWNKTEFEDKFYDDLFNPLLDTLQLTSRFYPQLLDLKEQKAFNYHIWNTIYSLKLDKQIAQTVFDEQAEFLHQETKSLLEKYDLDKALDSLPDLPEYFHLEKLINLLGELSVNENTGKLLLSLQYLPNSNLQVQLIDALLMQKITVPKANYERVASVPYYWHELLISLNIENHLSAIPKNLFTPETTFEAYATNALEEKYGRLTRFDLVDHVPFSFEAKKLKLYRYIFEFADYEGIYLGICSQPKNGDCEISPAIFDYSNTKLEANNENLEAVFQEMIGDWK